MEKPKEGKVVFSIYFYIFGKMKDQFNGNTVSKHDIETYLTWWKIPKPLRRVVIKEMEILNLLEIKNKEQVKLSDRNNPLDNTSKLYKDVGLWG